MIKISSLPIILTACLGMLSQGCSTGVKENSSEALKIAYAAGLDKMRDLKYEKFNKMLRTNYKNNEAEYNTIMALGTQQGFFSPPPGMSSGAGASLYVLGFLFSPAEAHSYGHFFAWMPKFEAVSETEAQKKMQRYIVDAYKKALPGYKISQVNGVPHMSNSNNHPEEYLSIKGKNCLPECSVYRGPFAKYEVPHDEKAPDELGGYASWSWEYKKFSRSRAIPLVGYPISETNIPLDKKLQILTNVSRNLPDWVYMYVAPSKQGWGLPMLLNRGKVMLFVEKPQ